MRQYQGIEPVGTRAIGELVPPGYLDTPCARCGHLPGVEVLSNGNMIILESCNHMHCPECGFLPPELRGNCCIFQTSLTAAPVLNATHPHIFLQQTPVSAENVAYLQRHRIPNMWRGANPVPEFWRDLRIAHEQRSVYTRANDPRRRERFEADIAREGLDPRLCRRRIVELRLLQRQEAERARLNRYRNRIGSFVQNLPRVSYGRLTQGQECAICLVEYGLTDPQEASSHMPVRLPCGHVFRADCLARWLMDRMGNGCPMCRAVVIIGQGARHGFNYQEIRNNLINNQGTQNSQSILVAQHEIVNQGTQTAQNIQNQNSNRNIQGTQINQGIPTWQSVRRARRNGA